MGKFIGRERELKELKDEHLANRASLVVVSGRRRIGKTALIEQFSQPYPFYKFTGLAPFAGMSAQTQRQAFARSLETQFDLFSIKQTQWEDLFRQLAKQLDEKEAIILLDEISWMAHGDSAFLSQLKTVWDDQFSKNSRLMLILCGSVSAWIEEKIIHHTGYLGRPSWFIRLGELPLDKCNQFWPQPCRQIAAFEKLKLLAVTGGVPRYLELMDPHKTAEENIQRLCFNKNGPLYKEFEYIFSDIYGIKTKRYQSIVLGLSQGAQNRAEIAAYSDLSESGELTQYLIDLELGGFIQKDTTWNLKTTKASKLSRYRLKDNYTRFYLKYILPNKSKVEKDLLTQISLSNLPGWQSMIALQFENLVYNNFNNLIDALKISKEDILFANPYFQRKTARQEALQIDYLIQVKQDTVYICEIKFSRKLIAIEIIESLKTKAKKLALPKYVSKRFVLIHVNGVSEELLEAQFFEKIIDFSDFLTKDFL